MNSPLASNQGLVQIAPFTKDCKGEGLRSFDRESNSLSAIYEGEQNPPPFFAASPSASQSRNASRTDEVAPACTTGSVEPGRIQSRQLSVDATPTATNPAPAQQRLSREQLVGMARLAADSPLTQHKRATEYFELPVRSVLNKCDAPRVPFEWSINPYRGCEFGCVYCYARYTHEFMELDGHDFERKIFVKKNAATLLARDIEEQSARVTSRLGEPEAIALGTATDPYQPAERDFGVTRGLLEKMAEREGLELSITTKSDLVARDIDVLKRIHERSHLSINLTITTPRPRLARMLEPRAPRPDLRMAAVRKLREAGLHAGVFVMPILPGLTDRESDLELLAKMAHEAGAEWFTGAVLWLMPVARREVLPFIEAKFPKLARSYKKWYSQNVYAPQHYREEIALRVSRVRSRYRMGSRPYFTTLPNAAKPQPAPVAAQLSLRLRAAS